MDDLCSPVPYGVMAEVSSPALQRQRHGGEAEPGAGQVAVHLGSLGMPEPLPARGASRSHQALERGSRTLDLQGQRCPISFPKATQSQSV